MTERTEGSVSAADPLLYSVEEAARLLGLGRTSTFHLVTRGEIGSVKIGRCRKIPHDALTEYVKRLQTEQASGATNCYMTFCTTCGADEVEG